VKEMVKRGKRLPIDIALGYEHPITKKLVQKKYSWICGICGREFTFRGQAEDCEDSHLIKKLEGNKGVEVNDNNESFRC